MSKSGKKRTEVTDIVPVEVVQKAESDAVRLVGISQTLSITTAEDENAAYETLKDIKTAIKTIEDKRKEITQPLNQSLKAANTLFKRLSQPFEDADGTIREKILAFRKAEAEKAEKKNAIREKIQARHEAMGHETKELEKIQPKVAEDTVIVKRWTFCIVDKELVPRSYMKVDEQLIREAIRQGVREIEGVKIYQEEGLRA